VTGQITIDEPREIFHVYESVLYLVLKPRTFLLFLAITEKKSRF